MYRIQANPLTVATQLPRGLTTLGVSWLRGHFEAVAIHRGEVAGSWHSTEPFEEPERFGQALHLAVAATGYQGNSVQLVIAHPRLTHQLVDVPAANGAALQPIVRRQVERLKVFEESAAWSFEASEPTKTSGSALVHLLPKSLLDRLSASAEQLGLHLASVVPPTAILHAHLARLPIQGREIALLAADFGGSTTVVVGRREGPLLLARSLDAARARGGSALDVDLNRTLLFVNQHFGASVHGVWLFGPNLPGRVDELRPQVQVPIHPSPEPFTPQYWAREVVRTSGEAIPNLITADQIRAPKRKALLKLTSVLAAAAVLTTLSAAAWLEFRTNHENRTVERLRYLASQLQAQHVSLQKTHLALTNRERLVQQVLDDRPSPIPIWFLAYLAEATPASLILTNVEIARETNSWRVRIAGTAQPAIGTAGDSMERGLDQFVRDLRDGPFHASMVPVTSESPPRVPHPRSMTDAIANWAAQLKGPAPAAPTPRHQFTLEALLR